MRTVWVSFDVIGRDCLEVAAEAGAEIVAVVTLPGPVDSNRSGQVEFADIARRHGARLIETTDANSSSTIRALREERPNLIFVVGWSQLVREDFLALAPGGVFGMHPSLLPRHRGRAPIPWAILSGLARTGVTLFEITDPTADAGPIVGQAVVEIAADETASSLYERLARAHLDLMREYVPKLIAGNAPRVRQDERRSSWWPKRTLADGIIDWETRANYLYDWVRAQTRPYPGAFTYLGDDKIVVWRARAVEGSGPAGVVLEERAEGPVVACGEGALLLEEVEAPAPLAVGARLG
jgi:methionyl-tRNA formyltransferase